MAFLEPTGSTSGINPRDCRAITDRVVGVNTYSRLWLDNDVIVDVDAAPADLVAEIDTAAGLTVTTLWTIALTGLANFGDATEIYLAGQSVSDVRLNPSPYAGGGVRMRVAGITQPVDVAGTTVTPMVALLDATVKAPV